jgi:hypothetical protein
MIPLQTSASMIPLQTSASMIPLQTSANMIPLQTSANMIPLQTSASMIPLSSVDVVIGFLLEVERLLWWSSLLKNPFGTVSFSIRPLTTLRFASLLINLYAIEF